MVGMDGVSGNSGAAAVPLVQLFALDGDSDMSDPCVDKVSDEGESDEVNNEITVLFDISCVQGVCLIKLASEVFLGVAVFGISDELYYIVIHIKCMTINKRVEDQLFLVKVKAIILY